MDKCLGSPKNAVFTRVFLDFATDFCYRNRKKITTEPATREGVRWKNFMLNRVPFINPHRTVLSPYQQMVNTNEKLASKTVANGMHFAIF